MSADFENDRVCARYLSERAAGACRDAANGAKSVRSSIALYWRGEDASLFSDAVRLWQTRVSALADALEELGGDILRAADLAESEAEARERRTAASAVGGSVLASGRTAKSSSSGRASSAVTGAAEAAKAAKQTAAKPAPAQKKASSAVTSAAEAASKAASGANKSTSSAKGGTSSGKEDIASGAASAVQNAAKAFADLLGGKK